MRGRSVARNSLSRGKSPDSFTAISTHSSGVLAMSSVNPRLLAWLKPARDATVRPHKLTIGTPIR